MVSPASHQHAFGQRQPAPAADRQGGHQAAKGSEAPGRIPETLESGVPTGLWYPAGKQSLPFAGKARSHKARSHKPVPILQGAG
ncbi:MAG: hypothetical protein CL542_11605 [Alcanivorax sp.]|nr:hypothetical protein [Alcanivorax sp.]